MEFNSRPGRAPLHLDATALRFALVFPVLLSAALVAGGVLIGRQMSRGVILPWGGTPVSLPIFLAAGVLLILLTGAGLGSFGARTTLSRPLRRVLLGTAMALQLTACTLFAATLLGQSGQGEFPVERIDGYVMLMGTGLAAAMGLVLALTFKPDEQWSTDDDAALAALVEPVAPAESSRFSYFLHPRSSVIIMLTMTALLPGALLALLSPWILLALVLAALLVIAMLCASVTLDDRQLSVKVLGLIPVIVVPCQRVAGAVPLRVATGDHGGWGLRKHSGSASFLTGSGAAVVLRQNDGGKVVVGAPNQEVADELASLLNRHAGRGTAQP